MRARYGVAVMVVALSTAQSAAAQDGGRPRIDITVERADLSFPELQRLVPALERVQLPADFRVEQLQARGPLGNITIDFVLQSSGSRIAGTVTGDLTGPQRAVAGTTRFTSANLARLLARQWLPTNLTGATMFDLAIDTSGRIPSLNGTFTVEGASVDMAGYAAHSLSAGGRLKGQTLTLERLRARAYGASITASGQIELPFGGRATTYTLEGQAANLDLRRVPDALPLPDLPSDLDFSYDIRNRGAGLSGRVRLNQSELAGATITRGTVATFDATGEPFAYTATGGVQRLDPQRLADALELETLAQDRFAGEIAGTFSVEGRGTALQPLKLALTDSRMFGGRFPTLHATVTLRDRRLQFSAAGQFASIDPGTVLQQDDVTGELTGTLDLAGALARSGEPFTWRDLALAGRVHLTGGRLEGVPIERMDVEGTYEDLVLRLAQFELQGPGVRATAQGTLAFDASVPSSLTYAVNTPQLAAFQDLIGRPVEGDIRLEGRVTGTRALQVTGTLAGTDVGYGEVEATTINAKYDVSVPAAAPAKANGQATIDATFVRIAGRTLTEATVAATYADRVAQFDAHLQEGSRTVASTGRLVLQPSRQQVYLTSFRFDAPGTTWEMPPGSEARIDYGGEGVTVDGFRLRGAPGELIVADGTLGREAGAGLLEIWVEGVSLASVDSLVLDEQGLAGRVDAYAALRGPLARPAIEGRLEVQNGSIRTFTFQQFRAAIERSNGDYQFTARLLENPASWLTAEGRLPETLFGGEAAAGAARGMDVRIRSEGMALGFVGALTERVQQVQGTLETDVRMTGTLERPTLAGEATLRNGAFTAPALGTAFTGLQARLTFEPDAMVVSEFRILDENGEPLSARGRLPYAGGRLGEVNIAVNSDNFELVDNDLGDVPVTVEATVTGTLLAPRLEGTVRVPAGELRVDRILDLGGTGLYRAAPLPGTKGADAGTEPGGDGALLRDVPVALALTVELPALQLTGRDLRGPRSIPVGVGDLSATVEGEVRLEKATDGPLVITGDITTERGTYDFHGRRFEILRGGTIAFPGLAEVNPVLDVTAERVISGVQTQVHIQGTMREPELRLTSQPPLDQADILSLVVFNQPANQLGAIEQISLGRRAAALAAGFVASQLAGSVGGALNLDIFEIETGDNLEGLSPVLTVGEQVGERLFLRVRQPIGGPGATHLALEYEVADWLRLQSQVSEERDEAQSLFRRTERSALKAIVSFGY